MLKTNISPAAMMQVLQSVLVALSTVGVTLAQIDPATMPECATQCLDNMQNKFGDFQCASRDDLTCLCRAPAWRDGIADCARGSCGGDDTLGFRQLTAYTNEQCAIATGIAPEQPNSTGTAGLTQAPPTEVAPTTEAVPAPWWLASNKDTPESSFAPSLFKTTLVTSTKSSGAGTDSAPSSESSWTIGSVDKGQDDDDSGNSLNLGAKIGIAVGGGAAAVMVLALIIALCIRRRDRKRSQNGKVLDISSPMPGSGRSFATDDVVKPASAANGRGLGSSHLEISSTRYENMVPRTQPSLTQVRKP